MTHTSTERWRKYYNPDEDCFAFPCVIDKDYRKFINYLKLSDINYMATPIYKPEYYVHVVLKD